MPPRPLLRALAGCLTGLLALLYVTAPTHAGECRGADMLAEMSASDPAAHAKVRDGAKALENTEALLWKAEKAGAAPSYLFGTMHLSDARITTLPPKVLQALKASKFLVLEVGDLSPGALAAAMLTSPADLVYSDGRTLSAQLSAEEFAKVKTIVASSGMPGDFANMLKPWLVSTLLSVSDCERKQVAAGRKVLDMKLAEEAKKLALPVKGLESIEQQLAALSGVPDDQQLQMLRVALKFSDRTDDLMETMVQLYLNRDMGAAMPFQLALAAQMGVPATAFDGFQKLLLTDRNAHMAQKALPMLAEGKAFIAVGALHLPGKGGLVALLREAGYTVTPAE